MTATVADAAPSFGSRPDPGRSRRNLSFLIDNPESPLNLAQNVPALRERESIPSRASVILASNRLTLTIRSGLDAVQL